MGIIHALLRLLLELLAPGAAGRHRVGTRREVPPSVRRTEGAGQATAPNRQRAQGRATRPRSPYGLGERLAGEDSALVRPYLVAYERQGERARQHLRRLSLVMAADFGIDLDARDVHAAGAAW